MDPNTSGNQPNPTNAPGVPPIPRRGPLDSNQAAELIRQQLSAIYTAQDSHLSANPQPKAESSEHFNPYQEKDSPPQVAQAPQTVQAPIPPHTPYFNPYHNRADTPQQETVPLVAPPVQPVQPVAPSAQALPGAAPRAENYRNNYSTFAIPGAQTAILPTEQPAVAPTPPPMVVNAQTSPPAQFGPELPMATIAQLKENVVKKVKRANASKRHSKLKPFIVSLAIGLIFLGLNYNEIAVAQVKQYISPGDSISTPVILDPTITENVGKENKIIIPKINLDVPVVYDIKGFDEAEIQAGLERGVVHYGNTAMPGEKGNTVIVGHSSNNYFNSGEYKFAFVLLFRLENNDTFILNYEGKRYIYKVFNKQVINPNDFSLVQPTNKPIVTLITCTPPGTSWKRLVIQAEQISPDPAEATKSSATSAPVEEQSVVPGNAPSLWSRLIDSIF